MELVDELPIEIVAGAVGFDKDGIGNEGWISGGDDGIEVGSKDVKGDAIPPDWLLLAAVPGWLTSAFKLGVGSATEAG